MSSIWQWSIDLAIRVSYPWPSHFPGVSGILFNYDLWYDFKLVFDVSHFIVLCTLRYIDWGQELSYVSLSVMLYPLWEIGIEISLFLYYIGVYTLVAPLQEGREYQK